MIITCAPPYEPKRPMPSCLQIQEVEKGYYADGEDAYDMRNNFGGAPPAKG